MARQELMGLYARVVWSTNKGYVGIEGVIITESRNMIVLRTKNSAIRKIPKKSVILEVLFPNSGNVRINGAQIVGRPENRIKMKIRKMNRKT